MTVYVLTWTYEDEHEVIGVYKYYHEALAERQKRMGAKSYYIEEFYLNE